MTLTGESEKVSLDSLVVNPKIRLITYTVPPNEVPEFWGRLAETEKLGL